MPKKAYEGGALCFRRIEREVELLEEGGGGVDCTLSYPTVDNIFV